ncbi:MAG: hypothetical protein ABEK36_01880 [Candidatus Aenigmatarchaeota archaeon]
MKLIKNLKESLFFLKKYPKFFVPSMISITIWTGFYILLLDTLTSITLTNYVNTVSGSLSSLLLLILLFSPISVLIYAMYPTLVKDYEEKKSFSFKKAIRIAFQRFPQIFASMVLPSLFISFMASPFVALIIWGYIQESMYLSILGGIVTLIIFVVFTVMFYFAPTSIILKGDNVSDSFRKSWDMGKKNFSELSLIIILSLVILLIGYSIPNKLKLVGMSGFIIGRYLEGILETYLKVINPNIYLDIEEEDF